MVFGRLFSQLITTAVVVRGAVSVGSVLAAARVAKPRFLSYADDNNDDPDTDSYESQSLDDLAAEISEENDAKLAAKPTMPYESIEGVLGSAYVDTFEGARMIVQKQVNLNTVVSHFYHLGMAQRPSFYRYSLILADPIDGTRLTVHTEDLQNISGDLNAQVNDSVGLKADFTMTEKGNTYTTTCNVAGTKCHGQVQFAFDPNSFGGNMMSMAYMQGVTEKWTFGGQSMFIANKGVLINSFAGVYDDGDNCLAGQYGGGMSLFRAMYMRRVNPNRVTLCTDLTVDQERNSTMSVSAEYQLKHATVKASLDSNLMLKSTLTNKISPGTEFALSAELQQAKEHFKFGYSIIMG